MLKLECRQRINPYEGPCGLWLLGLNPCGSGLRFAHKQGVAHTGMRNVCSTTTRITAWTYLCMHGHICHIFNICTCAYISISIIVVIAGSPKVPAPAALTTQSRRTGFRKPPNSKLPRSLAGRSPLNDTGYEESQSVFEGCSLGPTTRPRKQKRGPSRRAPEWK